MKRRSFLKITAGALAALILPAKKALSKPVRYDLPGGRSRWYEYFDKPSSICPVCGTSDVHMSDGDFRCYKCGAEGSLHVQYQWSRFVQ